MDEPEKSHSCDAPGCTMQFEDVSHLVVHKKKHEMVLNFGNGQKSTFVADQTPTPTRFIRNCEELGLFQDLQNVNPFEETFRKAVETGKTGYGALQEVQQLQVAAGSDDTLHTPHVFPYIPEDAPSSTSPVRSIIASLASSGSAKSRSSASDDVAVISVGLKSGEDLIVPEVLPAELSRVVVRQEADTSSPKTKQYSAVQSMVVDRGVKAEPDGNVSAVQLLLRMPDGKLVALSNLEASNVHPTVLTFAPAHSTPPQVQIVCDNVESLPANANGKSKVVEPVGNSQPAKVSLAKLKLKEVLTNVSKARARKNGAAADSGPQPTKVGIPRKMPRHENSTISSLTPSSTSSAGSVDAAKPEDDAAERKRKFLERNRAAAMRCREKRRSWIQELERRSHELEATNQQLQTEVAGLRSEVAQLKTLLLAHKNCPVTQALAQGAQVTIASVPQQQQQVISVTLPVTDAAGGVILANAVPSRIVSPPARLAAAHTPVVTLNSRAQGQDGAAKCRCIVPAAESPAAPCSSSSEPPPEPQIISVANLQPATTYILTAAPHAEPLQVIKVNPNATSSPRGEVRKMEVDSDSDVEVVGEISMGDQPDS